MSIVTAEIAKFRTSAMARNATWLLAGQGLGLVLQAVYFVILARLLGPVQYGVYAGAFAFASLVAQYSALGTGTLFLRYVSSDRSTFAVYWGNILVVTSVVGGGLVVALDLLGPRVLNPASAALVLLAAIGNCICQQLTIESGRVFQTFEKMGWTALINLLTNLVRTIAAAAMLIAMHRCTAWQWALVSTLVSAVAATAIVVTITLRFGRPRFDPKLFQKRGAEGLGFAVAMSTSSLYNDLDKTMLSHYGMNHDNGIYTVAYRIVDIATIPIFSIRDAAMPRFFKLGRDGIAASAELAFRLLRRTLALGALGTVAMFLAAPLIPVVVGKGFIEGVAALRWLCLIPLFRSVHQMTGCALTGAGMQRYRTATQLIAATLNFFLNLWLIPRWGWHGAAWSSLCTDAALGAMNSVILRFQLSRHPYA
jgi:O-antigen/teichoic acid export membrane protein